MKRFGTKLKNQLQAHRRGAITVLAALLSIVMLGMVAFSVDVGYVLSVKEELQRTADATALAAVWDYGQRMADGDDFILSEQSARQTAQSYATSNEVANNGPLLDQNTRNSPNGDLLFGYVNDFYSPQLTTGTATQANPYNAVRVLVRRDADLNGQAPLFFARVFGMNGADLRAEATAALARDVKGFTTPQGGLSIDLLPFALDLDTWNTWMAGSGSDNWTWDEENNVIRSGGDEKLEVNLYPQGTGSPGNRGTVDIGSSNNSTADIARQILHGVNASDLAYHGGSLVFDENGELFLNGDTGISAGVKDELTAIKGQPRCIPIFREVNGPGNNAIYTIVKWMGIRIVDVKLTGAMSQKRVTIQAAPLVCPAVVPATTTGSSSYVYSPAVLVR